MARQTHDREDLFRDGTQMPIRGRCRIEKAGMGNTEVVVGFRDAGSENPFGSASLYWDQDPVYQFNTAGELRRVFFGGVRYSAENGVLLRLGSSRDRASSDSSQPAVEQLNLSRHPISKNESNEILDHLHSCMSQLSASLQSIDRSAGDHPNWQSKGETVTEFCQRLTGWIATIKTPCAIANGPAVNET